MSRECVARCPTYLALGGVGHLQSREGPPADDVHVELAGAVDDEGDREGVVLDLPGGEAHGHFEGDAGREHGGGAVHPQRPGLLEGALDGDVGLGVVVGDPQDRLLDYSAATRRGDEAGGEIVLEEGEAGEGGVERGC